MIKYKNLSDRMDINFEYAKNLLLEHKMTLPPIKKYQVKHIFEEGDLALKIYGTGPNKGFFIIRIQSNPNSSIEFYSTEFEYEV